MKSRTTLGVVVGIFALCAGSHRAVAEVACSKEPPTPKGHIVAKIVDVRALGSSGKSRIVLDKGTNAKVETGDDVHLLTCEGKVIPHADIEVDDLGDDRAEALGNFGTAPIKGNYVAIDIGYESATPGTAAPQKLPPGWQGALIQGPGGRKGEIILGAALKRGFLPGDRGFVLSDAGGKIEGCAVEISKLNRKGEAFASVSCDYKAKPGASERVAIETRKTSCIPTVADLPQGTKGSVPPGFLWATVVTSSSDPETTWIDYTIVLNKGTADGVLPGASVYLFGGGVPALLMQKSRVVVLSAEKTSSTMVARVSKGFKVENAMVAKSTCR